MLEFVEGTLPATLSAAVAEHIRECPSCMLELEAQSSRTRALQKLGRVSAPDQWQEISRSIRRAGFWYHLRRYGLPAAVFGVAAAVAFTILNALVGYSRGNGAGASAGPAVGTAATQGGPGGSREGAAEVGTAVASHGEGTLSAAATGEAEDRLRHTETYDALEADHYGSMLEQLLGDEAEVLMAKGEATD